MHHLGLSLSLTTSFLLVKLVKASLGLSKDGRLAHSCVMGEDS
jgi:hypothetical protein